MAPKTKKGSAIAAKPEEDTEDSYNPESEIEKASEPPSPMKEQIQAEAAESVEADLHEPFRPFLFSLRVNVPYRFYHFALCLPLAIFYIYVGVKHFLNLSLFINALGIQRDGFDTSLHRMYIHTTGIIELFGGLWLAFAPTQRIEIFSFSKASGYRHYFWLTAPIVLGLVTLAMLPLTIKMYQQSLVFGYNQDEDGYENGIEEVITSEDGHYVRIGLHVASIFWFKMLHDSNWGQYDHKWVEA